LIQKDLAFGASSFSSVVGQHLVAELVAFWGESVKEVSVFRSSRSASRTRPWLTALSGIAKLKAMLGAGKVRGCKTQASQ
jgi:hypothetical protein